MGKFWSSAVSAGADLRRGHVRRRRRSTTFGCRKDISEHGHTIDHLFYFILWLTGVVFVATEVLLFWFLWRYDAPDERRAGEVHARQPHAGSRLDDSAGRHAAVHRHLPDERLGRRQDAQARTMPPDGRSHRRGSSSGGCATRAKTASSTRRTTSIVVNDLHFPVNEEILVELKSQDVLHSFFLPNMRVKQDAVPGMKIPVWFRADRRRARTTWSVPSCAAGDITR